VTGLAGTVDIVDDVAAAFAATVIATYRARPGPRFVLVLSGGPTARRCYQALAHAAGSRIDWSQVDIAMGDERCVAPDDPDANQRLVRESLIDPVGGVGSFHPMSCDEGPEAYERALAGLGTFDLVHLGLGPDGHTASLFPDSAALDAPPGRLAVRSSDPNARNPYERMTLTLEALARARLVVFTVSGQDKREAMAAIAAGTDLPGARVRAPQVLWLIDRDAAGQLGPAAVPGTASTGPPEGDG
jgi:6-phosphogluconolactonase